MILKCPYHGFETWRLVQYFYNGLTQTNRNMIESMNGGGFFSLVDDEAYKFPENFFESSQQWDFSNCKERSTPAIKKGGLYEVSEDLDIKARLDNLTCKVEALALGRGMKRRTTHHLFQFRILVPPLIRGLFIKLHSLKV